ncbi:MAG TPA: hypothetical protein VM532_15520 [Burkholderiales bacterium]|nr:hypothetical protein [Burkholderiales bacterium]
MSEIGWKAVVHRAGLTLDGSRTIYREIQVSLRETKRADQSEQRRPSRSPHVMVTIARGSCDVRFRNRDYHRRGDTEHQKYRPERV